MGCACRSAMHPRDSVRPATRYDLPCSAGYIDAVIQSPTERPPARIVLRVRHPEGQPIRSVTVDGRPHSDFDPAAQLIHLAPAATPISVRIAY